MRVTAAVVEALDAPFAIEQLELDEPGPGEALVRTIAAGICHTDAITRHGDVPMPFPAVLGHEGAGEVRGRAGVSTVLAAFRLRKRRLCAERVGLGVQGRLVDAQIRDAEPRSRPWALNRSGSLVTLVPSYR